MGKYTLDYFSKYYFLEEEDFIKQEEGSYILEQIKLGNRFDYKGHSYKYTKFNNISKSDTKRNVELEILENNINVLINGELKHLDLIYKLDTRKLEDHIRITTRISEKNDDISCIMYIDNEHGDAFIKDLEVIKALQENLMNK